MTGGGIQTALVAMLGLLLLAAAVTDIRSRTISNLLTGAVALLAPIYWWSVGISPWPDMAIQLALGVGIFGLFAIAFIIGAMGGGDVKLLAALALWLPWQGLVAMLVMMSILGGVLTLVMVVVHRLRKSQVKLEVPYGVAIAAAGLWAIGEPYLNHSV